MSKKPPTCDELARLEAQLKAETDKYLLLKQTIARDLSDKIPRKKTILNQSREAEFYKDKVNQINPHKLKRRLISLNYEAGEVRLKHEELKRLRRELEEYRGLEPSNEALERKIDELKRNRLSLEMSFSWCEY